MSQPQKAEAKAAVRRRHVSADTFYNLAIDVSTACDRFWHRRGVDPTEFSLWRRSGSGIQINYQLED
jgi:hypothetical protein